MKRPVLHGFERFRQGQGGEPPQQGREGDPHLHAGQRGAEAVVHAVAEGQVSGRANTALNLLVFAGAFGLQWGIGGFVDALQAGGWATDAAYRTAFLTLLGGQALALVWLLLSARRG